MIIVVIILIFACIFTKCEYSENKVTVKLTKYTAYLYIVTIVECLTL